MPFYRETGFSKEEVAIITNAFGIVVTMSGAFLGGLLIYKYTIMRTMLIGALLVAITNLFFAGLDIAYVLFKEKLNDFESLSLLLILSGGIGNLLDRTFRGYVVDFIHGPSFMMANTNIELEFEKLKKTFVSKFNIFWLILFLPGFIVGILLAFQIEVDDILNLPSNISIVTLLGSAGAILSIFMWSLNPLSDFQCSTDKSRGLLSRVVDTTNFVSTWVICGFLVFEIFMFFSSIATTQ